jgi:flavin-binding protein dodecin
MWVSKVSQIIGSSTTSFEDAANAVVERAQRTLQGISGVEVLEKSAKIVDGEIVEFRVRLKLVFDLAPHTDQHW